MFGFLFYSTNSIINLLEKVSDLNIYIEGIDSIPQNPCLFVANHFSRFETIIIPYLLQKTRERDTRSLADYTLFEDKNISKYLNNAGCVSTKNPNRNEIILYDLIFAQCDWIIYPEGSMVVNKNIQKKSSSYYIDWSNGKELEKIHTGAFLLALQAQFYKKDTQKYLSLCKQLNCSYKQCFPAEQDIEIVPISINYHPLITDKTKHPIQRWYKDWDTLPTTTKEEITTEYNLLFKTEKHLIFSPSISVKKFSEEYLPNKNMEIEEKITYLVPQLTDYVMNIIYKNMYISTENIFVLSLYTLKGKSFDEQELINLFFYHCFLFSQSNEVNSYSREHMNFFLRNSPKQFLSKDNHFHLALNQLIKDKFIHIENDQMSLTDKLFKVHTELSSIRTQNSPQILYNEIKLFPQLNKLIIYKKENFVKKELTKLLVEQEQKIFDVQYEQYYDKKFSQAQAQARPKLTISNKKNSHITIICHGFKSSAAEVVDLAKYLNEQGENTFLMRIYGHGTSPQNLADTHHNDWIDSFEKSVIAMAQSFEKINLIGFSTGGLLSLLFTNKYPTLINKVIPISPAAKLNDFRINFVFFVHFWNKISEIFSHRLKKKYLTDHPENSYINYNRIHISSIYELSKLISKSVNNLDNYLAPTLFIKNDKDPIVSPKGIEDIFKVIKSKRKEIFTVSCSKHTICHKHKHWDYLPMFEKIKNFIQE